MNYKERFYKHYGLNKCDVLPCIICNGVSTNLHHVKYKSQGGTCKPENLVPLCYYHHASHHEQNKPTTEEIKAKQLLTYVPF